MVRGGSYDAVPSGGQTPADKEMGWASPQPAQKRSWFSTHKLLSALIACILVVVLALAVGLGAGLGTKDSSNKSTANAGSDNANSNSGSTGSNANGASGNGGGSSSATGTATGAAPSASITALAKFDMTDPNTKMYGASLGNWLVLERWVDEDWFTSTAGDDVWDEWGFIEALGKDAALTALQNHWNSWVSEAEFDTMKNAGFNTIRIPVGYWAFVDAAEGEPYLAKSGQTEQLQKVLGWLYNRGMYASIDLHGMPGSQNGDQSSGHNTSSSSTKIGWFSDANQQLSLETLNATIAWVQASNYSSVVASIGIVNEPRPWDSSFSSSQQTSNVAALKSYYQKGYEYCMAAGITAIFHHGFYSGSGTAANYWRDFATGKNPQYLAFEDHPYPGWFTPNNNSRTYMQDNACGLVQGSVGYPIPMVFTEWSSINGVGSQSWTQTYTDLQITGYAWSGGSVFWTFKTMNSSNPVIALADEEQTLYSALDMLKTGVIGAPSSGQSLVQWVQTIEGGNTCGSFQTPSYTNPSTSGTSYSRRNKVRSKDHSKRLDVDGVKSSRDILLGLEAEDEDA